ncbi:MAG: CD225/dispanin family protein [Fimbriimonadaceae bacterium]
MASRYYVVGEDGQKYGPADLVSLNRWIREGRLLPSMFLEEELTGMRVAAGMLSGLDFGGMPYSPPSVAGSTPPIGGYPTASPPTYPVGSSVGSPYYRPSQPIGLAWPFVKAILSCVLCCMPLGLVAIVFAVLAMSQASQGNLVDAHNSLARSNAWANWAVAAGLLVLCLYLPIMLFPVI